MSEWWLSSGGNDRGPLREGEVLASIQHGVAHNARVRQVNEETWQRLTDTEPFAGALRARAETRRLGVLAQLRTVLSGLTFVVLASFLTWIVLTHREELERTNARVADLNANIKNVERQVTLQGASTWVSADDALHNRLATNDAATCTVTNVRDEPITTCVRAVLSKREAGGATLNSLPMCTGRLGPRETRTVSVPWVGGFARDLCNKKTYYGETLDWEQCRFSTEAVNVEAKPAKAPSAAASSKTGALAP